MFRETIKVFQLLNKGVKIIKGFQFLNELLFHCRLQFKGGGKGNVYRWFQCAVNPMVQRNLFPDFIDPFPQSNWRKDCYKV
ncbi:hypothetical protein D3C71_1686810 [compost metagenome]